MYTYPKKYWYILLAFAAMATVYLYNPFQLFFLADDFLHIPQSANSLWVQQNSLRPIGNFTLHLDYLFSEKNPLGYHITNLILHLLNTLLVWVVARTIIKNYIKNSPVFLPIAIAFFFFTYPFHSEAVFWIIGRSGSLGSLFFLAALICFFKKSQSFLFTVFSLIFFQLALFSYESSWIFPLIISLILFADSRKKNNSFIQHWGYLFLIIVQFIIHLVVRWSATGELMNHYDAASFTNFNIPLLGTNFIRLLARTFVPPFYSNQYFIYSFIAIFLIIGSFVFVLFKQKKINPFFIYLTAIWLISYLPYLSIGIDTHGVEGERYLYLPSVVFSIWLLYLLAQIFNQKQFIFLVSMLLVVNLYFLNQSRTYYSKAGKITSTTIHQINKLGIKKIIFFKNLPQYNKGAVVFRSGLENAINWLSNNKQQHIIIVSKDNSDEVPIQQHDENFAMNYTRDSTVAPINKIMVLDKSFKKNYIAKDTFGLFFNPKYHAMFTYSNSGLIISH